MTRRRALKRRPFADQQKLPKDFAHSWRSQKKPRNEVRYCKCAFTDPDGTIVPGEACPIHPGAMTCET